MSKETSIIVSATDKATGTFKKVWNSLESFAKKYEKQFKQMGVIWWAVFGTISLWAKKAIDAFADSEAQLARTDQAIKNIDLAWMWTTFAVASKKAREFGAELQKVAWIGDEAGSESFAKLLSITKDYTEATKMATLAADLSVAKQIDMDSATKLVSMALAGNTRALKEYWIEIDESMSKQEIMWLLMEKVWWQAEAFWQTTAWKIQILKETFGDLSESIGWALAPVLTQVINKLWPVIAKVMEWIEKNPELTQKIILITAAIAWFIAILWGIWLALPAIVSWLSLLFSPFWLLIGLISLLGIARTENFWWIQEKTKALLETVWPIFWQIRTTIKTTMEQIRATIKEVREMIQKNFDESGINLLQVVYATFIAIAEGIRLQVEIISTIILSIIKILWQIIAFINNVFSWNRQGAWDNIVGIFQWIWTWLANILETLFPWIINSITWFIWTIKDFFDWLRWYIRDWVNSVGDWVTSKIKAIQDKIKSMIEWAKNTASSIWGSIVNWVKSAWNWIAWKAVWWTTLANKPYLVGERWPEIFTPATTGRISNPTTSASININMWGVQVYNEADENRLVNKISSELNRQMQLYQLGIN